MDPAELELEAESTIDTPSEVWTNPEPYSCGGPFESRGNNLWRFEAGFGGGSPPFSFSSIFSFISVFINERSLKAK